MKYRPKIVRCRLKTGGKSIAQIQEKYKWQGLTRRDYENIQKAGQEFDGLVVLLSLWAYDNHENYHLHNWDVADDGKVMLGLFYAEQVHPFTRYKNNFAKFRLEWEAGLYEPTGSLTFVPEEVEELEIVSEEEIKE